MSDNIFLHETEKKVFSYMEENHMMNPGDSIVLGVSGGADSVCMLALLLRYRETHPLEIAVVHVNHGVREDAGDDAAFVAELCAVFNIPFYLYGCDIHALAAEEKCSVEDAGRRFRYKAFEEVRSKISADKIAVAHNADDRAETVLLHLFRGAGLRGLRGIEPKRDRIIRPILCLTRAEVERYVTERKFSFRQDSTNFTDDYTRNRIRHHVLPYVEQEISANVTEHLCRTAETAAETEAFLAELTKEAYENCVHDTYVDVQAFLRTAPLLQKRVLLILCESLSPTGKDISAVHIRDVQSLFSEAGNRSIDLPYGICFRRSYDKVYFAEETVDKDTLGRVTLQDFSVEPPVDFPREVYTKWFDYDKLKAAPEVRFRRTGDYLMVSNGSGKLVRKTVKEYMIDEKIPANLRDSIPVVASGDHVLWIVGYRISEYFKVTAETTHILQAQFEPDILR